MPCEDGTEKLGYGNDKDLCIPVTDDPDNDGGSSENTESSENSDPPENSESSEN